MKSILKKEIAAFFNTLIGYIVIALFLILTALFLWIYPNSNVLDYGFAEMNSFFDFCPYIFLFLIPAVTMRLFSEEFKSGTMELLFTKPLSLNSIILGKYFAALLILALALIPTLFYFVSIYLLGNPVGNIDSAAVFSSYVGLFFLGAAFTSIGLFFSVLTSNQVIAFVLSASSCFVLYDGLSSLSQILRGNMAYYLNYCSLSYHYNALSKGLIDSRNIIFILSVILVFLFFTRFFLDKKRQ